MAITMLLLPISPSRAVITHENTYFCLGPTRGTGVDFIPATSNGEFNIEFSVMQKIPVHAFLYLKSEVTLYFENSVFSVVGDDELAYDKILSHDNFKINLAKGKIYTLFFWNPNINRANVSYVITEIEQTQDIGQFVLLSSGFAIATILVFFYLKHRIKLSNP